jgi:flagellar biosynthesis chaperone FliJ
MKITFYENCVNTFKETDEKFHGLQELIDYKIQFLINKQKKIQVSLKQNEFLETVRNDYIRYNDYINQQKTQQIKALELLNEYINDLKVLGELTKYNIEDAKEEQSKILREIKSIKKKLYSIKNNLDSIITPTEE